MFLPYIHRFRGIAILFIFSGHCIRVFNWENGSQIEKILKAVLLNGTVLFVFIAGFLFQHLSTRYTYKTYIKKKIKNIIIPYVVISVPAIFYLVFIEKLGHWAYPDLNHESYFFQIFWFYITGKHLAPLWFIPMIAILYILYPVFRLIDENQKTYYILLPASLFLSALVHRPPAETNVIHTLMYFSSVYLLGMWFSRNKDKILPVIEKMSVWLIIVVLILLTVEVLFYEHTGIIYVNKMFFHDKELININLFQKLLLCGLILNFLFKHSHLFDRPFLNYMLNTLAGLSIGIYFAHYYFIDLLLKIKRNLGFELSGSMFNFFLLSALVGFLSVASLKLAKFLIGKRSRNIIGC